MEKYGKYFLPCTDRIASVSMFNQGRDAWCADAACASVPCPDCILCCNNGDSASKIKAFGDWAVSEGYKVTRPEYLAMTSDSHAVIESSDTDDADEDECTCTCKYCEKQFSSDDEYTDLCPDCQTDYDNGDIRQCTRCRCYLNTDDGCYIEDSGEWYCHDCAESRAHHCDDCGEWYLYYHNVQTDDYRCICNRCYERHDYYTCDSCGMILDDDDVYWHSDTSYCESCCPSGVINEYGYSPEPCFSSTNRDDEDGDPIYLGFELEAGDAEA